MAIHCSVFLSSFTSNTNTIILKNQPEKQKLNVQTSYLIPLDTWQRGPTMGLTAGLSVCHV